MQVTFSYPVDHEIARINHKLLQLSHQQLAEAQLFRKAVDDENFRVFLKYRSRFLVFSWTRSLCLCVGSRQESQRIYNHTRRFIDELKHE